MVKKTTIETIFLVVALVAGTLLVFLTPPFQSPDEYNHFFKSWQVSSGQMVPEKTADHRLGGPLPRSLDSLARAFLYLKNDYSARTSAGALIDHCRLPLHASDTVFTDFANTAVYAPTAYLPQATAIALLRPLAPPPLLLLYAVRLANLLAWTLLVFAALRALEPKHRFAAIYLALLPASLAIAASANADVITNGLCLWLIARALGSANERQPAWPEAVALAVVAMNKLVFTPLALVFFLKPGVSNRRRMALLGVTLIAAAAWAWLADDWFIPYDDYHPDFRDRQTLNEGVDPALQRDFIVQHPAFFAQVLAGSWAEALPSLAAHLVGKFGWEKNYLPPAGIALLWLGMAGVLCTTQVRTRLGVRIALAGIALLCLLLFSATMYALWCPVGADTLTNLQGRYFFPLLPLALWIAGNGALFNYRALLQRIGLVILFSGNLFLLYALWNRYYG